MPATADAYLPSCSVIIPTRGRPRLLAECLRSIAESDYPAEKLEVIVVDDGGSSSDIDTPFEVSILRSDHVGPAAARNAGAAHAGGEILAFTDDDCRVSARWLTHLARAIGDNHDLAAGGHTVNALDGNHWSSASQRIIDLVYGQYNDADGSATFLTTNNLAVPGEAFREVGGFDDTFRTAEDRDFCRRWRRRGLDLRYEPKALVFHAQALTFAGFVRQHFAYGRGAFRYHFGPNSRTSDELRTLTRFYKSVPRLGGNVVDLAVWQAANGAGFAYEAIKTLGARATE